MRSENEYKASLLVSQALLEIEQIVEAKDQNYTDYQTNPEHFWKKRKFTLADAKPRARAASKLLREAWELLDPCGEPPTTRKQPSY